MQGAEGAVEAARSDDFAAFPVSYVDDVGIWKDVEPVFRGCMPLKNLNWKRRSSGGQYLLGTVDLAFHPHDAQQLNWGGFLPLGSPMVNYYRKPYLYIYFAICEDNDVYRDVLRPKLTEWTNLHTAKQQEWLIIHVQGRQSLGKSAIGALNSAFNRSPFDKIRDDFRRVVQLRLTEKDDKRREMVDGLSSKLSECFLSALDQRVSEYEEEIRKMLQRRMVPGWNYCTFFLVKEALAIICEAASLLDEALLQYTELEVLFNEEVNGKQPNRMAVFFPPEPEASSVFRWEIIGLVAPTKRPYREMLSKNSISEFEFLEYLFARQLHLWFGLDRISDVTSRTHHFISDMERRFRLHAASLPPTFANAWMCCAAQCLVDKCTAWFQSNPLSPNLSAQRPSVTTSNTSSGKMIPEITITTLSAAEADLYHLARLKLDRLGAQSGLLEVNSSRINMGRIGRMTAETLAQPSPAATPLPAELPLRLGVAARHMRHASGQIRPEDLAPPTASIDLKGSDDAGAFPPPAVPALASAPATFSSTQFAPPPPPALTLPAIPAPEAAPEAKKPVATEEPDKATLSPRQRSASVSTNQRSRRPYDPPIGGPGPGAALKKALQSGAEFDSLYIELSECAAIRYRESFRSRHVITVNNDVASLYMERGRFADAEALLKSISQVLFSEGWHALNLYALAKLAECQRALNHHFEYISTCLSILSLPVDAHSHASQDIARFYQTELLNIASNLQQPVLRDMHPTFNVTINTKGAATRSLVVGELLSVECDLSTLLPEPIVVDSVQLKFAERASSTAVNARAAVSQSSEGIEAGRRASLRSVFLQSPGKVTLPPGSQKAVRVRLERRLMDAGEFTVERILLHIGQLGLTHVLRQVPLSISVAQSHPSLELSLVHDKGDRQVIGQSKPIHLIVKTNLDAVQSGSLVVSLLSGSSSQLASASFTPQFVLESLKKSAYFLIHHASEDLSQAKRVPFTLAPTATATVVSAPVSDVPPNHMLHFYIDLLMPMSQSEENVAFKKEISCKLKYLKVPDGKYEVEATEELRFQPPFAVAATLHPTGAKDRMMLQIECKNTLWTAAAVRKYALALAGGVKVIADPNGGLLKGYDLAARHVLSLSFIVQVEPGTTEVTGGLTLDYTTPLAQECQPFYHPIKLPIVIPRQLQIEIATRSPPSCTVASFFLLEYVVQRLDDGGEPVQVRCEVAADSKEWMLAGRRKNSFELRAGERRVFAFRAMAVRCGYLLLPVMTLRNAPAVFVDRAKQIHIFPLSHRPLVEIAQHAKTL